MAKEIVHIYITGELRNCVDQIENWESNFCPKLEKRYYFYIWDEIGKVDASKFHLRNLPTTKFLGLHFTKISIIGQYRAKNRVLDSEIREIKNILKERCCINIFPFNQSYHTNINTVEVPMWLREATWPWWRGWLPLMYLNALAVNNLNQVGNDQDIFCRMQSETLFPKKVDLNKSHIRKAFYTSSETINPNEQISLKFFATNRKTFAKVMDVLPTWHQIVDAHPKNSRAERLIGEKFLFDTLKRQQIDIKFDVETKINREQYYPKYGIYLPTGAIRNRTFPLVTI